MAGECYYHYFIVKNIAGLLKATKEDSIKAQRHNKLGLHPWQPLLKSGDILLVPGTALEVLFAAVAGSACPSYYHYSSSTGSMYPAAAAATAMV